ncbi:MAG: sigma-54-dependent Fis family transcriptional regulator [Calditrichaeota bacterium]|nr:MAG: sigma-54-dependent Fis family transcriptional regulator [Calditrichota bacterium]
MNNETILVVDDDPVFLELLTDVLQFEGYEVHCSADGRTALDLLESLLPDLILLDLSLPDIDGIEVLKRGLEMHPSLAAVMISGQGTIKRAVEATKLGAYDFLEKPIEAHRVLLTVKNVLAISLSKKTQEISMQETWQKYRMIGVSQAAQKIFAVIDTLDGTKTAVHICGESGSGKYLVAKALHKNSPRKDAAFVHVNCASIPDTLIESELFGHEKGAFTDAQMKKKGYFQQAQGGTLFLDEIGDLSLAAQAKILLALDNGEVQRIGAEVSEFVDVRLISASNKNLEKLVASNEFREDLYYRINVVPITIPPLRERTDDIFPMAEHFLGAICELNNLPQKELLEDCGPFLRNQPWKGNARELKNFIEKVAVLTTSHKINRQMLQLALNFPDIPATSSYQRETLREARNSFESDYIQVVLRECNSNITKAATVLDIERTHLHKKMKQLGIGGI